MNRFRPCCHSYWLAYPRKSWFRNGLCWQRQQLFYSTSSVLYSILKCNLSHSLCITPRNLKPDHMYSSLFPMCHHHLTPHHLTTSPNHSTTSPFTTSPTHHLSTSPPHHLHLTTSHHLTNSPPHYLSTSPPHLH